MQTAEHEAWLEERSKGVGSSDAATILGANHWMSRVELWEQKTGKVEPDDISNKPAVVAGNLLEPVVAKMFQDRHPELLVIDQGEYANYVSPKYPWMRATPDRIVEYPDGTWALAEIKTTKYLWPKDVPDKKAYIQLHHQAVVVETQTGKEMDHGWVIVFMQGQDYQEYRVELDRQLMASIITETKLFWDHVINDTRPPVEEPLAVDSVAKVLKRMYPEDDGTQIELDPSMEEWHNKYQHANEQVAHWSKEKANAKNVIVAALGDAKRGTIPGVGSYSYGTTHKQSYQTKPTTYRTLRFNNKGA